MLHGCMVYTERAETAAVSCGTSHASAVNTPLRLILKNGYTKASHSRRITCERSELSKSDQKEQPRVQDLCESRGGRPGFPSLISVLFLWT